MTSAELEGVICMKKMGGSFASALAEAWLNADHVNSEKLKQAFPELLERYTAMAEQLLRKQYRGTYRERMTQSYEDLNNALNRTQPK